MKCPKCEKLMFAGWVSGRIEAYKCSCGFVLSPIEDVSEESLKTYMERKFGTKFKGGVLDTSSLA